MNIQQALLSNGLQVILAESHASPVISTWMWYRVGSRNEDGLPSGLSHWVEHMLFKGSERYPKGSIMRLVSQHGGYVNAMTSHDFTAYYATLASECADLALEYEADRMSGALFDPDECESERTVILAEREGSENQPGEVLNEELHATAFRRHPYRNQTIGWREDLLRITRDDLYNHYRTHYVPNNAVMVVAGDLDPHATLERIERLFGDIPQGSLATRSVPVEPRQVGERRVNLHLPGAASIIEMGYRVPQASHADFVPLVIATALLSGGNAIYSFGSGHSRSARLYRALVETGLASSTGADYHPSIDPYLFSVGATVTQGTEPLAVEQAIFTQIQRLQEDPAPAEELAIAVRQTQAQFAYSSESVTSQALTLGFLEMVDRVERIDSVMDDLQQVTPEDVMRVARTYLDVSQRTVGWYIPSEAGGGDAEDDDDDESYDEGYGHTAWRRHIWGLSRPLQGVEAPAIERATLDNGITVLLQARETSAAVSLGGHLAMGSYLDEPGTLGITHLTASMLRRGTRAHSFQEINASLDNVAASLSFSAGRDELSVGARALGGDLDLVLDLLSEILAEPAFPETELERLKGQLLTTIAELDMDTGYRSHLAFIESLYGSAHPYGRPLIGTPEVVRRLTSQDLMSMYQNYLHPRDAILAIVGGIEPRAALERLNETLGRWQPDSHPEAWTSPTLDLPDSPIMRTIDIPARPQLDLMLGVLSMPRHTGDYYAAVVANVILGELGMMGRLGATLRDDQGLAYDIGSDLHSAKTQRSWTVTAGVAPQVLAGTISAIEAEIDRMREELVSPEELADAQTLLIGSLPLHMETNEGIVSYLLSVERHGLGLDYVRRYPDIIRRVTAEQVREVMRRYWPQGRYVVTAAGTLET